MSRTVYATAVFPATSLALSNAVPLEGATPGVLVLPATWAAANITFQGSVDGVTFGDIWTGDSGAAAEYTVSTAALATRCLVIDWNKFVGFTHIKVRSGTGGIPVNQAANAVVQVGLRDFS